MARLPKFTLVRRFFETLGKKASEAMDGAVKVAMDGFGAFDDAAGLLSGDRKSPRPKKRRRAGVVGQPTSKSGGARRVGTRRAQHDRVHPTKRRAQVRKKAVKPAAHGAEPRKEKSAPKSVPTLRVGVLDLGTWVGGLPSLLTTLNRSQKLFKIFEVQAPVPAGLLKTREGMLEWLRGQSVELRSVQRKELERQLIADDFFKAGTDIASSLDLDLIVGLTPAMVAGTNTEGVYWNHFVSISGKTLVVSTAQLRELANKADRPFEAAVGALMAGALLVAVNPELHYHCDTGCLLDYNQKRVTLVDSLHALRLDQQCQHKLTPPQSKAAAGMLAALRRMPQDRT